MISIKLAGCAGLMLLLAASCGYKEPRFAPEQAAAVKDSVQQTMQNIARDISTKGPLAWLTYFETTPGFLMADEGSLAFADNKTATTFVTDSLPKFIHSVHLQWRDIRIDPFTATLAGIAAGYHEDITNAGGELNSTDGYFTAVAEKNSSGWQLRNLHWSVVCK